MLKNFANFFFIILLCCCTRVSSEKQVKRHLKEIEDKIVINGEEDFNSFLGFFRTDSILQRERSNFTQRISRTYSDPNSGAMMDSSEVFDSNKDWRFIYGRLKGSIELPVKSTESDKDTAVVMLINSDISGYQNIKWKFIKVKGKWEAILFTDLAGGEFSFEPGDSTINMSDVK